MSGKAPSNYRRRSVGIPHVSKGLTPNVACPGCSLIVFAREREWNVILGSLFQTLLADIFQTKEQSEPKEHTVSSCNIVVLSSRKKNVCERESNPFPGWNCSLLACIEFLVMLSPSPEGSRSSWDGLDMNHWKKGQSLLTVVAHLCTWCKSFSPYLVNLYKDICFGYMLAIFLIRVIIVN